MTEKKQANHHPRKSPDARNQRIGDPKTSLIHRDADLKKYAGFIQDSELSEAQKLDAVVALRELLHCIWGPNSEPFEASDLD